MIWLILNKVNFEEAKQIKADDRIPYLEMQAIMNLKAIKKGQMGEGKTMPQPMLDRFMKMGQSLQMAQDLPSPRTIKSHLPLEFLPPKLLDTCKVIFVGRNPKDTCVSFYHFAQQLPNVEYKGTYCNSLNTFISHSSHSFLKVILNSL